MAVAKYDSQVAANFTEEQRYESAQETAKSLGGTLIRNTPIQKGLLVGRNQVIEVTGIATIHTHAFLVGNRSYQIQVTYPSGTMLDPDLERVFLESQIINYRPDVK